MGTTLVEELEQAATRAEIMAQETTLRRAGVRWVYLRKNHLDEAARLRARSAHVREMERQIRGRDPACASAGLFRALTGPLPATPPETQGDPQPKGQP